MGQPSNGPSNPKGPQGEGEAAGRARGYEQDGGKPGNDLLEDGQLRGVDADGQVVTGTHGGPAKKKDEPAPQGS